MSVGLAAVGIVVLCRLFLGGFPDGMTTCGPRPHLPYMIDLPSGKLTWQWKMEQLKMYSLLKNGDFPASHVSLLEGILNFN